MRKKGELSSAQIVGIVLAVGSFILVLIFASLFFQSKDAFGDEACKLSVLTRASVPIGADLAPLKCSTKKICITGSLFGKCKQFAGESNVQRVRINLNNHEEAVRTIEKESANAMYDCWNLMGQGKLDVLTKESAAGTVKGWLGFSGIKFKVSEPRCVVCSRVAIADDVYQNKKGNDIVNGVDINSYMANNAVPLSDLSYLETFTDRNVKSYAGIDKVNKSVINTDPKKSNQLAFIFMQMKTDVSPSDAVKSVALGAFVVGAGGLMTSPGRIVAKSVTRVVGWPALALAAAGVAGTAGFAAYQAHKSQLVSAGYCGKYDDEDGGKVGCSLVKGVNWDVKTVNDLCYGGIEGEL